MIIQKGQAPSDRRTEQEAARFGALETLRLPDAVGLKQFGANLQTLQPGATSNDRHWHEQEYKFHCVFSGEATLLADSGQHVLQLGDAACWLVGAANAHHVVNRSDAPCSNLIVGMRVTHDVCHYPDLKRTLHTGGDSWRLEAHDGSLIKSGKL